MEAVFFSSFILLRRISVSEIVRKILLNNVITYDNIIKCDIDGGGFHVNEVIKSMTNPLRLK